MNIFDRIIKLRNNNNKSDGNPISHLNVEIAEVQEGIFNPSDNDMAIGGILNNAGGKGTQMNITEKRLNSNG